ncbi:MAG: homoserine O-acetyltransferase [Candidatus Kapaibacterium sp.]|jgi:homoserine O-acetyltransferase
MIPPLDAQFYHHREQFILENGGILPELTIAFHTYGTLAEDGSNVVWVCHALTANSDCKDWWHGLIGKDKLFDPEKYFIVCANIIGSCYGTTSPCSIKSGVSIPSHTSFPLITIRDIVKAHILLRKHLGITSIYCLLGGSLGGQQVLEWAIMESHIIHNIIPIATNAQHSPWGIAWNTAQRMALESDPDFHSPKCGKCKNGLKAARAIAMLSYRHYATFDSTQKDHDANVDSFNADSYQRYQGDKLVQRFDAHCYYSLTKSMDSHNVGRNRISCESALNSIKAKSCVIGIDSDILFPIHEQEFIARNIHLSEFHSVTSLYGHDGFLLEYSQLQSIISKFLEQ